MLENDFDVLFEAIQVRDAGSTVCRSKLKVAFDYSTAIILLIATLPVLISVAILIKVESPGPVIFLQPRIGLGGEVFWIWKFRTMSHDKNQSSLDGSWQARRADIRITRVGKWLRKFSIDEVPQLVNVIKGEMSLVGPRPHPLRVQVEGKLFQEVVSNYAARHQVLPGITGWAQVNGWRGETVVVEQVKQRVAYDLFYIQNWSFAFDLRILFLTLTTCFFNDGAF